VDVRLLGALDHAWDAVGRPPAQWLVYRTGDISQRRMLQQLDYVPCFPADAVQQPPARLLRAMAAGSVVIVPERFRTVYGDAAVYAAPGDVLGRIRHLEQHPAERAELARAAERHLETQHRGEQFVTLVVGLLEHAGAARRTA
jgi:O-antigen biosynthesis protein